MISLHRCHQSGQAVLEALIAMLALAVLWFGVAWLGRIQDLALQASHAARYSAFMATRINDEGSRSDNILPVSQPDVATSPRQHDLFVDAVTTAVRHSSFDGSGNQWSYRNGMALQRAVYQDIDIRFSRHSVLPSLKQIGGSDDHLVQLREDWLDAPEGVLSAQISLMPSAVFLKQIHDISVAADKTNVSLKLHQFDNAYPAIRRHTSILTGAGHAGSDSLAASRVAASALGWSGPAEKSYRLGRRVAAIASKVDAGWSRPEPVFDWLAPWAGTAPLHHLHPLP